jgi:CRISPR system Cascade subunit CasE
MHSFQPNIGALVRLAARERLLPPGDDLGYAIHAVLSATFGEHAPKPWGYFAPGHGGGPAGRLLAYSTTPLRELIAYADAFADPSFSSTLDLSAAATKTVPAIGPGARLGFRVRVRPVARTGASLPGHPSAAERERARERDVYLARIAAAERRNVFAGAPDEEVSATVPSRAACYLEWFAERLTSAGATLERASMDAFRLTRLMTRARGETVRGTRHPEGPDATITGTLVVADDQRFRDGLAHGIGRFRAFGFGMLVLAPPRG